jgi:hypothetical protein
MDPYVFGIIVLCIIVVVILAMMPVAKLNYVESPLDGDDYIVDSSFTQSDEAAYALSILNQRIVLLLAYLKKTWPNDPAVQRMLKHYSPDRLAEITPVNTFGYTSYTVDEGKSMRFCLRDKTTFNLHDLDELTFVAYHELSHVADWKSNHEQPFWEMFKWILQQASVSNIYQPTNYAMAPMDYCGMRVAYNPFYDDYLPAYVPQTTPVSAIRQFVGL